MMTLLYLRTCVEICVESKELGREGERKREKERGGQIEGEEKREKERKRVG